jgi:hypothetical protein
MSFQNEPVELGAGMVFCCESHGRIQKDQADDFHPKPRKELSGKEKYEAKRRERRKYTCLDCGFTFEGSGSWQQAAEHERLWSHSLVQGPDRKRVSWIAGAAAPEG